MSKVSILVAAYNAERTLPRCLDSLLVQTVGDVQVVVIDDCSNDGTPGIAERYREQFGERLVVIRNKENEGQARARNKGLQVADGEYITMVDSDDYLSPDALQSALDTFDAHPQTDCVVFRLVEVYPDGEVPYAKHPEGDCFTGQEAFRLSMEWTLHGLYVARRSLYEQQPFDDTCRLYSDDNTTHLHFLHSREVRLCRGIYYYVKDGASTTNRVSFDRFLYLPAQLSLKQKLSKEEVDEDVLSRFERGRWIKIVELYLYYCRNRHYFTAAQRRAALAYIRTSLASLEAYRIPLSFRLRPGYYPFKSFTLFRIQETIYYYYRKTVRDKC